MRSRLAIAIGALALGALVVAVAWPSGSVSSSGAVASSTSLRYAWPRGESWQYRLETTSESEVRLVAAARARGDGRFEGKVDLAGAVVLRSYGPRGDITRLGLRFESLDRHDLTIAGESLLTGEIVKTRLLPHEAFLDVTNRGEVRAIRFLPEAPPLFRGLVQLVVGEMQVRLGDDPDGWTTAETSQHGDASTTYRVTEDAGERVGLEKRRDAYDRLSALPRAEQVARQTVESAGQAVVTRGGPLRSVDLHERLRAFDAGARPLLTAESHTRLKLMSRSTFDPSAAPDEARLTAVYRQGEPAFDAALADRQHARQRIAGLTPDALLNTLAQFAPGGTVPDHNRFLWRATGLLRERPELCKRLVELFVQPDQTPRGRALLLDLLAGAGTPAAQAALRRALETSEALADPTYRRLYQRLSLVQRPTPETIALLARRYAEPGPEGPRAATYALGSGAGHLHRAGDAARAQALGDRLEEDLEAASTSFQRASLLGALGNAALPGQLEVIARYADDKHPDVREAAATALRHADDDQTRDTLVELSADRVDRVARRAVRSLMRGELGSRQLARLRGLVAGEAISKTCYSEMVSLLAPYLRRSDDAEAIFRAMLTQRLKNPALKGRIRLLLGG